MKRYLLSMVLPLLLCTVLAAQTSIKVEAPNLVAADEQFNVSFVMEGEESPSDFKWSPGDDFQLVWGPQRGSSTSISIVNGKKTKSSQSTFTYVLLPKKTGTFTLAQATATVKGKRISSGQHRIEVVSNGTSSSNRQPQSSSSGQSSSSSSGAGTVSGEDIFLKLSLSKTNVVVGESITATLKLYQRVNVAGFEDAKFPLFNGFWSQEVQAPTNIEFHRESIGDMIYNAALLRSYVLIPQQAGELVIDPAELVCLVNVRSASSGRGSIFDSFFQDDYQTIRKRVTSSACRVNVSRLPAGAPASFTGAVGSFSMNAALSRDSLQTHDAASLKIVVSGRGNVSLLEAPKVKFPPDFESYDVKVTENTDKAAGRTSGSKTFEYPFIPRSHGDFTVDPVEFSYYDVDQHKYVTLTTDPMELRVARGKESDAPAQAQQGIQPSVMRKDVKSLGSDIRFISTRIPSFSASGRFFVWSGLFIALLALLIVTAVAFYLVSNMMAARRSDVVGAKNRAATKMARKRLSLAGDYLQKNLYSAFYEELHKALLGFIGDKLNMDAADMSKENIEAQLVACGAPEGLASDFVKLLDDCEFARYSPSTGQEAMSSHYQCAVSLISTLDSSMKHKGKKGAGISAALLLLLLISPSVNAAAPSQPDSLWTSGTAAYADGRWQDALDAWSAIAAFQVESPSLYCNMGDAFFKMEDYAHAILNYERALKLDPSYADARFNLEFANSFVQDRIESVPEFFLSAFVHKAARVLSSDLWAVLFLLFLAGALAMGLVFLLSSGPGARKTGFFTGIALLLVAVICLSFASSQKASYMKADSAIVVSAVSSVKSSPGSDTSKDLFILHEGTKVQMLDQIGEWTNISLSDGRQGWIKASDLEII